ncbi:MAG: hypothetical protein ACRC1H_07370, partial [Caldilineaceae bacterium]
LLATASFAEGERGASSVPVQPTPAGRPLMLPIAFSLTLVGIGLFCSAWLKALPGAAWLMIVGGLLSALSIILVISALRSPQRAGAELATPGRPTS